MKYMLIVGATSDMARALAELYAADGWNLYLTARHAEDIDPLARDLRLRFGIDTRVFKLDILSYQDFEDFYGNLDPKPSVVAIFVGYLSDQARAQKDIEETVRTIRVNFEGPACFLNVVAEDMECRGEGCIKGHIQGPPEA